MPTRNKAPDIFQPSHLARYNAPGLYNFTTFLFNTQKNSWVTERFSNLHI